MTTASTFQKSKMTVGKWLNIKLLSKYFLVKKVLNILCEIKWISKCETISIVTGNYASTLFNIISVMPFLSAPTYNMTLTAWYRTIMFLYSAIQKQVGRGWGWACRDYKTTWCSHYKGIKLLQRTRLFILYNTAAHSPIMLWGNCYTT